MKLIIIISFISISVFGQFDSVKKNTLYVDYSIRVEQFISLINDMHGYPRQDAITYIDCRYDSVLCKFAIKLDRVTELYLKTAVLDKRDLPVIRLPLSVITPTIRMKLKNEIIDNNWNTYIKNDNLWLFNFNLDAGDTFTQNQIDFIINNGGQVWNF